MVEESILSGKFIYLVIAAVLLINLIATARVLRIVGLSTGQKASQLALIWFAPIVGAIVCMVFDATDSSSDSYNTSAASSHTELHAGAADTNGYDTGSIHTDCASDSSSSDCGVDGGSGGGD